MRTLVAALLLLVLSITSNAQKLDGSWKGIRQTPNGDMTMTYTFKVDGEALTGTIASERGSFPIENGKVKGNEFSFDISFNGNVRTSTGVLNGDVIKLSRPGSDQPPMELTRIKDDANVDSKVDSKNVSKIDGKWIGKAGGPDQQFELTFTFKVDGNKLTGKSSSQMGDTELSNGVVNGNDFSFDIDMQGMKISHKGKYLEGDTIELKVNFNDQDMVMKLARAAQ